jgi:hypothetical protein
MRRAGLWVGIAGTALLVAAVVVLVATGKTEVRYTADNDDTQPMWFLWIPAAVGILLVRLVPLRLDRAPGGPPDRRQAWLFLAAAGTGGSSASTWRRRW